MSSDADLLKLRLDLLAEEIKTLNAQESWGTTLFLTAIALLTKQLIDWSVAPGPSLLSTPGIANALHAMPALIGLVGFVFLRVVNYRIRRVRTQAYLLLQPSASRVFSSLGLVGWSMAFLPPLLGYLATGWFLWLNPSLKSLFYPLLAALLVAFAVAVVLFVRQPHASSGVRGEA